MAGKKKVVKKSKAKATKKMTKSQIYKHISEETELSKVEVTGVIDSLLNLAYDQAKKNPSGFMIHGLGKLVLVQRKARMGRNPQTGEAIKIKAKKGVKFRVAKGCKDSILPEQAKKKKPKKKK